MAIDSNAPAPRETAPPTLADPPRFLVLVPLGVLFKCEYDGADESAAKAAYWRALKLNQVPVFVEVRQMVMV